MRRVHLYRHGRHAYLFATGRRQWALYAADGLGLPVTHLEGSLRHAKRHAKQIIDNNPDHFPTEEDNNENSN